MDRLLPHGQADRRGRRRRRRQALADNDEPIGTPALPIFDASSWRCPTPVADYVNVPLDQMTVLQRRLFDQPLVPEPSAHTQELYAILDSVVQAVLTDESADIAALLAEADEQVTALVEGS